jgi:nitrite reductase/ring-hydroxylating ferredoxin subunit
MEVEVAKITDIPPGGMKRVRAYDQDILLSNVDGKIYATSNRCGHSNASLARGMLQGKVVTCPLHAAKFDVTTGKNLSGPQLSMPPEVVQKLPQEMLAMMKQTADIVSEIQVEPLKMYKVGIKGTSVFLEGSTARP